MLAIPIPFTNTLMNKFLGNVEPDGSVFSKYQLLEENGTPPGCVPTFPGTTSIPFLPLRISLTTYRQCWWGSGHHAESALSTSGACRTAKKQPRWCPLQPISTALTAAPSSSSVATPLEIVKRTGQLAVTEHMTLDNTIKANLHTFDDRDDVARFVEASFADGLWRCCCRLWRNPHRRRTRASLCHGGKTCRDVSAEIWLPVCGKLTSGDVLIDWNARCCLCEHFTLTGRIDELPNLIAKTGVTASIFKLTQLTQHQPDYQTRLADIENGYINSRQYKHNGSVVPKLNNWLLRRMCCLVE